MDHSGHPAVTGNSAITNAASPAGTNLSAASASFMAANGSPFTSVDSMIQQGVRVVDPETTERTCTTTITARLNIPVVPASTTEGKLLLIMSADPLAQLPLWVSRTYNETTTNPSTSVSADAVIWNESIGSGTGTSSLTDPQSWGQTYDLIGLDDFFAQTTDLGNMSLKHRVVGCAMRANVGVDTSIARGSIEAGQFNWTDTRYKANEAGYVATGLASKSKSGWWQALYQPNSLTMSPEALPALQALSQQKGLGNLITSNAYQTGQRVIRSARTQDYGTLDADKGASVRWTDSNDFKFQKTYNRNVVVPDREYYPNGVTTFSDYSNGVPLENNESSTTALTDYYALNCNSYRTNQGDTIFAGRHDNQFRTGISRSKLATKKYTYKSLATNSDTRHQGSLYLAADNSTNVELLNGQLVFAGSRPTEAGVDVQQTVGEADRAALGVVDFESFFDKGLYINIEGVSTAQYVTVEMVYHIEYMPKSWALTRGVYPPIDLQFDMLASMLGDPKQFPIVVQGHSFFSSLWRGIKRAADTAAELAGGVGSAISAAGGAIDPRLALLGGALSGGANVYKRMRQ